MLTLQGGSKPDMGDTPTKRSSRPKRKKLDASESSWFGLSPNQRRLDELQAQLNKVNDLERRAEVAASSSIVF
jgi:hypothetical protein